VPDLLGRIDATSNASVAAGAVSDCALHYYASTRVSEIEMVPLRVHPRPPEMHFAQFPRLRLL